MRTSVSEARHRRSARVSIRVPGLNPKRILVTRLGLAPGSPGSLHVISVSMPPEAAGLVRQVGHLKGGRELRAGGRDGGTQRNRPGNPRKCQGAHASNLTYPELKPRESGGEGKHLLQVLG